MLTKPVQAGLSVILWCDEKERRMSPLTLECDECLCLTWLQPCVSYFFWSFVIPPPHLTHPTLHGWSSYKVIQPSLTFSQDNLFMAVKDIFSFWLKVVWYKLDKQNTCHVCVCMRVRVYESVCVCVVCSLCVWCVWSVCLWFVCSVHVLYVVPVSVLSTDVNIGNSVNEDTIDLNNLMTDVFTCFTSNVLLCQKSSAHLLKLTITFHMCVSHVVSFILKVDFCSQT